VKSYVVTIQMKATEHYFPVVLFIALYKVVLSFGLWMQSYGVTIQMKSPAALSHGTVYLQNEIWDFSFILILGAIESKRFKVLLTGGRLIKVLIYHLIGARTRGVSNSCPIRQFSNRADTCKSLTCVARVVRALKGSLGGVCRRGLQTLTVFKTKPVHFAALFKTKELFS